MPTTQADMVSRTDYLPGSIQRSPTSDGQMFSVRTVATGTIANTETTMDTIITDGIINIANVPIITVWFVAVEGSLTSATFWPQFSNENHAVEGWFNLAQVSSNNGGILGMEESVKLGLLASSGTSRGVISFANPGGTRMRFRVASVGTVTSSSLLLNVSFGFGIPTLQSYTAVV